MAAVLAFGRGALLSHTDAAALLDLRAPGSGRIHVTVGSRNGRGRPGLLLHRSQIHPEDRAMVDGIPVTAVPRTLLDLAEVVSHGQLQRAYEAAERLGRLDVTTIERLLARSNGRRGVGRLRALTDYDPAEAARARSDLESDFLDLVRAAALPSPAVNATVAGFEVDAYWPDARLVVELQSWAFHGNRRAFERDHRKAARLRSAGCDLLAFTHHQVNEESAPVVAQVRARLSRCAA
jgi:very-short-patch-repair endonuclease